MENLNTLTKYYFDLFQNKDLKSLEDLYHDEIILIDWTGQWYGKDSVLKSNSDLFVNEFDLFVHNTIINQNSSYNQISIRFDEELIEVLDVIEFNEQGKIIKLRAYKG